MTNTLRINVNEVKTALDLLRSFRNVPLDTIEWIDTSGKIYAHPKEEDTQDAGQGWWSLEDWKFCGLNNTSYFEQFIEPYIQVPEPKKPTNQYKLSYLDSSLGIDTDHLIALVDLRECIGRQMPKCPSCNTEQVQLMDNLTNPLHPSWRCRSCKHCFHTAPTIPFNLLIHARYGDLIKGQPVAAYIAENDQVAIPVHICKRLCCMNDGYNSLLSPYSVRLLTEEERLVFKSRIGQDFPEIDWFNLYS